MHNPEEMREHALVLKGSVAPYLEQASAALAESGEAYPEPERTNDALNRAQEALKWARSARPSHRPTGPYADFMNQHLDLALDQLENAVVIRRRNLEAKTPKDRDLATDVWRDGDKSRYQFLRYLQRWGA